MKWPTWKIECVQLEFVKCGKPGCKNDRHGPYWYGYNWSGIFQKSCYIGKQLPETLRHLAKAKDLAEDVPELVAEDLAEDLAGDLPGQMTLEDLVDTSLFGTLGIPEDSSRDKIRKAIYNRKKAKGCSIAHAEELDAQFASLCEQRGWTVPRGMATGEQK